MDIHNYLSYYLIRIVKIVLQNIRLEIIKKNCKNCNHIQFMQNKTNLLLQQKMFHLISNSTNISNKQEPILSPSTNYCWNLRASIYVKIIFMMNFPQFPGNKIIDAKIM